MGETNKNNKTIILQNEKKQSISDFTRTILNSAKKIYYLKQEKHNETCK